MSLRFPPFPADRARRARESWSAPEPACQSPRAAFTLASTDAAPLEREHPARESTERSINLSVDGGHQVVRDGSISWAARR